MGRRLGSYELVERLGEGGMGEVWWARHHLLNRPAAVKVIRPNVLGNRSDEKSKLMLRRFEREARAMSALTSPHTVQVYDFGLTDDGSFYYAMEMLDGCNLHSLVEHSGPIEPHRAVFLLDQVCESLSEAHYNELIHRDVKPANIFLCRVGLRCDFVKVLDFGLVKLPSSVENTDSLLTDDNVAQGTPAFIPPEVVEGSSRFDARSDIYALGCVAYWLLTGQLVFDGGTPLEIVTAHVAKQPVPPSKRTEVPIPGPLEDIVMQCLEKNPDARPDSVRSLAEMMRRCPLNEKWTHASAEAWWQTHQPHKWTQNEQAAGLLTRLSPMVDIAEPDKPSIIVLPFVNRSRDPEQEYFSDGITEDLITDLGKNASMFVIGRNTSFSYKDRGEDVKQICEQVGVRFALEGSVRRAGNRIRVSALLTDASTGTEVWAERFDRELTDIFEVQDDLTREIVSALKVELGDKAAAPNRAMRSPDPQAAELMWRMLDAQQQRSEEGNRMVRELAQRALDADPNNAEAYSMLSRVLTNDFLNQWNDPSDDALDIGLGLAEKAVELDADAYNPRISLALAHLWKGNPARALAAAEKTHERFPNSPEVYGLRGIALTYLGKPIEAIESLERAMRLDPAGLSIFLHYVAHCRFSLGQYDAAIDCCARRILRNPGTDITRVLLAASYAEVGRHEEARNAWRDALSANPKFSLQHKLATLPFADKSEYQKVIDALAKAGIP